MMQSGWSSTQTQPSDPHPALLVPCGTSAAQAVICDCVHLMTFAWIVGPEILDIGNRNTFIY